jgi:hypothetical protein
MKKGERSDKLVKFSMWCKKDSIKIHVELKDFGKTGPFAKKTLKG